MRLKLAVLNIILLWHPRQPEKVPAFELMLDNPKHISP